MKSIEAIIGSLRVAMTDARQNESHFESWMILNEAICDAIDALAEQPAQQEPVAWDGDCVLGHCGSPAGCEASNCCRADYTTPPQRKPLTDEQPKRWAVFCGICRKEWSVPYQHPGKSVCDDCVAAHGIKENT